MKVVTAIIRPYRLEGFLDALSPLGIDALTVTEVKGYGQKGSVEIYRGAVYATPFRPMIKIELAIAADQVERVIDTIIDAARTGHSGDGKIFVASLDDAMSIRTGIEDNKMPPLAA